MAQDTEASGDIEIELYPVAIAVGAVGALLATASTLLPSLFYLGSTGVLLAQHQLLLQLAGVGLVLGAAVVQAKRSTGDWSLHDGVLKQGAVTFVAAFLLISYGAVPVLAGTGNSGNSGSQQLQGENLKVAYLEVEGMVCQGCQASINGFLRRQSGIKMTKIRLAKSGGPVVYDASKLSAEEITQMQIFSGYYSATVRKVEKYTGGV